MIAALAAVAAAISTPQQEAAKNLESKSQCVTFEWGAGDNGEAHASIIVPVSIDGKTFRFQLDTAADFTLLYADQADKFAWVRPGVRSFRPVSLTVGSTSITRPVVVAMRENKVEADGVLSMPRCGRPSCSFR